MLFQTSVAGSTEQSRCRHSGACFFGDRNFCARNVTCLEGPEKAVKKFRAGECGGSQFVVGHNPIGFYRDVFSGRFFYTPFFQSFRDEFLDGFGIILGDSSEQDFLHI